MIEISDAMQRKIKFETNSRVPILYSLNENQLKVLHHFMSRL